jgi:hypothetical protein
LSGSISGKEREQISNRQGIEGSDPIINQILFPENNPQVIDQECDRTFSEMNFARFSTLKTSKPLDLQAFKSRKETEKRTDELVLVNPVFPQSKTEVLRSLKIGDRVFSIDRPSYFLTVTKIVSDELIKAVTDGFRGAEFFPISELRLLGDVQFSEVQKA